jgi:hypothetical protein
MRMTGIIIVQKALSPARKVLEAGTPARGQQTALHSAEA